MLTTICVFLNLSRFKVIERKGHAGATEYVVAIKVDGHDVLQPVTYSSGRFCLHLDTASPFIPVALRGCATEIVGKGTVSPYAEQRRAIKPGYYASRRRAVTAEVTEYGHSVGVTGLSIIIRATSLEALQQFLPAFASGQKRLSQGFVRRDDDTTSRSQSRPTAQA